MKKWLAVFAVFPIVGWGQVADSSNTGSETEAKPGLATSIVIPEVVVLRPIYNAPVKNEVNLDATAPLLNFVSGLNLLPGVSAQEGAANTAKFSYRGFGARSQYTTSRTLFYLDEIPITTLQGFSTFEDINPLYVGSAKLMGQGQGSYPNALGSVVQLNSAIWPSGLDWPWSARDHAIANVFTTGSFGLVSENLFYTNQRQGLVVAYENTQRKGWRENSAFKRQSFYLNGKQLLGNNLQLLVYGIKNRSEIPSSLSLSDFENSPEQAAPGWGRTEGYEQYDKLITGITYRNYPEYVEAHPAKVQLSSTVFYQYRDGFEPRPFNILDDQSHHGGLRGTAVKRFAGNSESKITAYTEYHLGTENATTFENLYDTLSDRYNNKGAEINDTRIFSQLLNAGMAFSSGFSKRDSTSHRFYYNLSVNGHYQTNVLNEETSYGAPLYLLPGVYLKYQPRDEFKAAPYFSVFRSHSIPSLEENLNPDGSLNTGLNPETAWTAELGLESPVRLSKWESQSANHVRFDWKPNLYYSEVKNLIVPRLIGPDQVVASNSGSSRHTGVEMDFGFRLSRSNYNAYKYSSRSKYSRLGVDINLSGYYGYFAYREFSDTTGVYDDNRLPGFPEWQATLSGEISYESLFYSRASATNEFTLGFQAQATGGYYIDDENTVRNQSFLLLQTWLGYQREFAGNWVLNIKAGVKNLTDTHYAAMTVVNNQAFGNAQPRYYYPGDPINWFGSLTVGYRF